MNCGMHSKEAGNRLNNQTHVQNIDWSFHQALRLGAFFGARDFVDAGAQQAAVASAATRLQSSGCPSQQSLTRKAITDRIPSTSER
jgi:hypothetical protein